MEERGAKQSDFRATPALHLLAALCLWLAARPYLGLIHDGRLYVGFALAQLSPDGVGRDLVFGLDRQSEFSVFPALLRPVVALLGAEGTGHVVSLAAVLLWFAALYALVRAVLPARLQLAALAVVALASSSYGAFEVFHYSEAMATPRPFAEAAALLGLAAFLTGRPGRGAASLAFAFALHPIMAAPAALILFCLLVARKRAWLILVPFAMLVAAAAFLADLGPAGRLLTSIDPQWRQVLADHPKYLFPSLWPAAAWVALTVKVVTACLFARRVSGKARTIVYASVAIGVAGVAAAFLFGDLVPSLLIAQAQLWRWSWILSVFAAVGLPLVIWSLVRKGSAPASMRGAALALAWVTIDQPMMAGGLLAICAALFVLERRRSELVSASHARWAWLFSIVVAAAYLVIDPYYFSRLVTGPYLPLWELPHLAAHYLILPLLTLLLLTMPLRKHWRIEVGPRVVVALALAAALVWMPFDREPRIDIPADSQAFRASVEDGTEVLVLPSPSGTSPYVGEAHMWVAHDRPQWFAWPQGAPSVFSRELALEWYRRVERLIALGLVPDPNRPSSTRLVSGRSSPLPAARLLCRSESDLGLVLIPYAAAAGAPAGTVHEVWPLQPPQLLIRREREVSDRIAVIDCRRLRGGGGPRPHRTMGPSFNA